MNSLQRDKLVLKVFKNYSVLFHNELHPQLYDKSGIMKRRLALKEILMAMDYWKCAIKSTEMKNENVNKART